MTKQNAFIEQIDRTLGNKIYNLRLFKGLTQEKLGKTIGVTAQQLQKYEKGINRISAGRIILIANALGKDLEFFYEGLGEGSNKNKEDIISTKRNRMCFELSMSFMKLKNPSHQNAINSLIKSLLKRSA